jgi:hypothetical protein
MMLRVNVFSLLATVSMVILCSHVQAQDAVVWLSFEGTGDIAADSSWNGNDGTIVGATRVGEAKGQGQGIALGKADTYVDVPIKLEQKGTVEFWFKPNWDGDEPLTYRLFDVGLGEIFWGIGKGIGTEGGVPDPGLHVDKFGLFFEDAADTDHVVAVPAEGSIMAGEWYHLAAVWDFESKMSAFYINGTEVVEVTAGFAGFPGISEASRIGFNVAAGPRPADNGADGIIDEFAMYHRALSAGEIRVDMQKGAAVEPLHKLAATWGKIRYESNHRDAENTENRRAEKGR